MRIECKLDRAGFWWRGLGLSIHLFRDEPVDGEGRAFWRPGGGWGAQVRLGEVTGYVSLAR